MLWLNSVCCYCIYNNSTKPSPDKNNKDKRHFDTSALIFTVATVIGTLIYYFFQSLYIVFLMTYATTTTVVVLWCSNYIFLNDCHGHANEKILKLLAKMALLFFFMIGLASWLVCTRALFYNPHLCGTTLHNNICHTHVHTTFSLYLTVSMRGLYIGRYASL